jgi:hypothetical protein
MGEKNMLSMTNLFAEGALLFYLTYYKENEN